MLDIKRVSLMIANYAAEEVLRDGSSIHIRAIRPADKQKLLAHFRGLSARSVYYRFFGFKRTLTDEDLVRLTELDFVNCVALVATLSDGREERFIGVGRYQRSADPARAEVAFAVLDQYQGRGIGTLLLEHLSRIAHGAGIREFIADVLGDNNRMLEVFLKSGFRVTSSRALGVVHVSFPTKASERFVGASLEREAEASARSVARILRPKSIAVVGASRDSRKVGAVILANLKSGGFKGPIYPINPHVAELQGLKAYPSVTAVGAPVEMAVIVVPAREVEAAVTDCAQAGVHSVVVISSGFAEVSEAGSACQQRLVELVRGSGMRMVGPNCMGVLNADPEVSMNATLAPFAPPGNIGFFSQSGALGITIFDYARARNLGLSSFVSGGNRADVSNNDLVAYWAQDPRTAVIALYLESFGNPRKFARLAPQVARRKPIVAVKSGRSAAGTRAAHSHSAALATLDVAVEALFEQAGVIRTTTLEELFDVLALLASQPIPKGPGVGVVSNAGGPAILLADACEGRGLELRALAPETLNVLRSFLPEEAGFSNPVDMTVSASGAHFERAMAAVGNDPSVDAVVAIYVPPTVTRPEETALGIARGAASVPAEKPVLTVFLSSAGAPAQLGRGPRGPLPSYPFPENAALALGAAYRYGQWRSRPRGTPLALGEFAESAIRAVIDRVLRDSDMPCWLEPEDVAMVLRGAGIDVVFAEQTTAQEAPLMAEQMGYPLVAKVVSKAVLHKTEVGGVITGLNSACDVEAAVTKLTERLHAIGAPLEGILLQREVRGGIEALIGVTSDPIFGPLIVCGLGGVAVELMRDVAFRLHPVTDVDADAMINQLRARLVLEGYRGSPPADRQALAQAILKISALVEVVPELVELDLNPIMVMPRDQGAIVVDARIRVRPLAVPLL